MLILTIIAGLLSKLPMGSFYWIKADTSKIPNAYKESAWTFWGVCQADDFHNCKYAPGLPINPASNFGTNDGVPQLFIDNGNTYYYLSRFAFAFAFLGLAFAGIALLVDIVGFWSEMTNYAVVFFSNLAVLFVAGLCALQTAVVVMARNAFRDSNLDTKVQVKSMAIMWSALAALLIVWVSAIAGLVATSFRNHINRTSGGSMPANDDSSFTRAPKEQPVNNAGGGIRFFKIKRNAKELDDDESV